MGRQAANAGAWVCSRVAAAWISSFGGSGIIGFFGVVDGGRVGSELRGGGDGAGDGLGSATEEVGGGAAGAEPPAAAEGEAV